MILELQTKIDALYQQIKFLRYEHPEIENDLREYFEKECFEELMSLYLMLVREKRKEKIKQGITL